MKRKILIVIYIILILITLKLLYNIISNSILISKYENGEYTASQAKALTYFNFPQSYVANYNYGNFLYQNGEYESAIEEYKKALNGGAPEEKKCNIRINYALAICQTIELNEEDQVSIQNTINVYESAIDVLTEEGCANRNDNNGHNQKAQQLKNDIQDEIDRLKKLLNNTEDDSENNTDKNDEEKNNETENIETKIQNIKEEATKEQRKTESQYKNYNYYDYNPGSKNW